MDDQEKRRLYRLNIAKWDMDKAVALLTMATTYPPTKLEFEALVTSGIIHYARPFSMNEREKDAKADSRVPSEVIDKLNSDEIKLHNLLIDRRNKAIAHAEWSKFPVGIDLDSNILSSRRYSIYPEFMDLQPSLALAKKLLSRLHNMVADHLSRRP
jgi:hypothetical protein